MTVKVRPGRSLELLDAGRRLLLEVRGDGGVEVEADNGAQQVRVLLQRDEVRHVAAFLAGA